MADILAELIKISLTFPDSYTSLQTLIGCENETFLNSIRREVEDQWKEGKDVFIGYYENKISLIKERMGKAKDTLNMCVIEAAVIALHIDSLIVYEGMGKVESYDEKALTSEQQERDSKNLKIDFSSLFKKHHGTFWQAAHLNSDASVRNTGIWLNPKFGPNLIVEDQLLGTERSPGNRDTLYHLNAGFTHICFYIKNRRSPSIRNIVLTPPKESKNSTIRIAFAPMLSSGEFPLELDDAEIVKGRFRKKGFRIRKLKNEDKFIRRFERDLSLAEKEKADIFFAPEMFGTDRMVGEDDGYSIGLQEILRKAGHRRIHYPSIVFFPSMWKDRKNTVYVAHKDASIIGTIQKSVPFISNEYGEEDLETVRKPELLVVHIPHITCVSAMICAQFLADDDQNFANILFRCIGVDLLLVPSFSSGERDFVNKLGRYQEYGVNVVWGDSCRATRSFKCPEWGSSGIGSCSVQKFCIHGNKCLEGVVKNCIVGAAFVAGTGQTFRFGEKAATNCGFRCLEEDACIFIVDIPFKTKWSKPEGTKLNPDTLIRHIYWKNSALRESSLKGGQKNEPHKR